LPSQTAFAKKATSLQEGDHSLFATRGDHRELHRPALDVEDSISCIPLRKDDLFVSVIPNSHPSAEFFAENCGTETESTFTRHPYLLGTINSSGNMVSFSRR
jgi:hypothetical protein